MGTALSRAAGTQLTLVERSLTKRLQSAFAARDGVEAAQLAACGVTSPARMFEGPGGFSELYGAVDAHKALDGLGREFLFPALTLKRHASCYCNHAAIEATLDLVRRHGLRAAEAGEITVRLTPFMARLVGAPYAPGDNPQVSAQFSVRYSVASILQRGRFTLDDILPAAATDQVVCALAGRVQVEIDESKAGRFLPAAVRVRTTSGKDLEATIATLAGTPADPFTDAEVRAKALACFGAGARPMAPDAATRIAERIAGLESVGDMREFLAST